VGIWAVLFDVVVLLGAGAALGGLFERARQNAIIGYLLAGALLGPNVLHVVHSGDEVLAVSELGVALLLFAIGLEFSWSRLRGMGAIALGSGAVQVVATAAVAAGVAVAAGQGAAAAVTLGSVCALSSTACVLRVLTARGEVESVQGERALGILLVQDVAVVPLVLVVSVLAEGGSAGEVVAGILRAAAIGLGLVGALWVVFNHAVPRLLATGAVHGNRELPLLIAVVSGLGSGVAAHALGLSPALGAFLAGMLLAESPFAVQVRADVSSLKTLLLTLFFAAMGMLTDPAWIASHALAVAVAVAAVLLGKAGVVWAALCLFRARRETALATGICLAQIGEFSFVLAGIARGTLLTEDVFLLVVSTAVITMFLTPYLVAVAPRLAARLVSRAPLARHDARADTAPGSESAPSGIVIGFGPAGRAAAERIAESGCRLVIVDQNPAAARDARALGYSAVTGDARYGEVLEHAGLQRAAFVFVTVPAAQSALEIVHYVRLHAPDALVLVRARFHRSLAGLRAAGAHVLIDEEHEVGRLVAAAYDELVGAARAAEGAEGEAG